MRALSIYRTATAISIWVATATTALSQEAVRLFDRGDYLGAAKVAQSDGTAAGDALAARATLAHAIYVATGAERSAGVARGENLARQALSRDPRNVEANLQLVIALHRKTLETTPTEAFFSGLANQAYDHLQIAVGLDPEDPWVNSMLGGWHFEVVRLAGPALASFLMDARLSDGRAAFAKALLRMPDSIVIRYEFARSLLLNDASENRTEALSLLRSALAVEPQTHIQRLIKNRAGELLRATASPASEGELAEVLRRLSE